MGANLKAPTTQEQGRRFWSYSLVCAVEPGDTVFHYHRGSHAIVGASTAKGSVWEDVITWGARGASARSLGIVPHTRPGWYLGLDSFRPVDPLLTLTAIRSRRDEIAAEYLELKEALGAPLYFPFEVESGRPLRPVQGYLFKLPKFFPELFPELGAALGASGAPSPIAAVLGLGADYRAADEQGSIAQRDPFSVDPALVERGLRGHAETQNSLAAFVASRGYSPRSPRAGEPSFDLAWTAPNGIWVAEIKSITPSNEERQLRLGLGQVIRYRHLLSHYGSVRAVLGLEHPPSDVTWLDLCGEAGVLLTWPGWEGLGGALAEPPLP